MPIGDALATEGGVFAVARAFSRFERRGLNRELPLPALSHIARDVLPCRFQSRFVIFFFNGIYAGRR